MIQKIVEGKNTSYVASLNKTLNTYPLYMDATALIEDAITSDLKSENGPNFAIEVARIDEYIGYVLDKIDIDNYQKFNTKSYSFFLGSLPKPE